MSKIESLGGALYKYTGGKYDFKVSLLAQKVVFLYGSIGYQYFSNPMNLGLSGLTSTYKTDEDIYGKAQLYLEGVTNKEAFNKEVNKLLIDKDITEHDKVALRKLIAGSDQPPETVRRQLMIMGYGHIADRMIFDDLDPRLVETCGAFRKFLECIPEYLASTREGEQEKTCVVHGEE